jgi:hypothetical protein
VDSQNRFSEQIDVVVFDRQYSPFIFKYANELVIPAESVYAVFEIKQSIDVNHVKYAQKKVASVRRLIEPACLSLMREVLIQQNRLFPFSEAC